jgi:hypothetical protein
LRLPSYFPINNPCSLGKIFPKKHTPKYGIQKLAQGRKPRITGYEKQKENRRYAELREKISRSVYPLSHHFIRGFFFHGELSKIFTFYFTPSPFFSGTFAKPERALIKISRTGKILVIETALRSLIK